MKILHFEQLMRKIGSFCFTEKFIIKKTLTSERFIICVHSCYAKFSSSCALSINT